MMPIVRWLLTVALLYIVWHHTHWSVALCLTLSAFFNEGLVIRLKQLLPNLTKK